MQVETQLEKRLQDKEKELDRKLLEVDIKSQLRADLDKRQISVPPYITMEEEKQRYIEEQKKGIESLLLSSYTHKQDGKGNLIWYDQEGKPQLNIKDGTPKKINALLDEKFYYWFVPEGRKAAGTDTHLQSQGVSFSSTEAIHKYLISRGMDPLTRDYREEFEMIAKESNINI